MSDDQDAEPTYDMVMPFLPVQSNGGPHDDDAYVAGWEAGHLDAALAGYRLNGTPLGNSDVWTLHEENTAQADIIAMRWGYVAEFAEPENGWVHMQLSEPTEPLGEVS